jgi:outer membrane usher protein
MVGCASHRAASQERGEGTDAADPLTRHLVNLVRDRPRPGALTLPIPPPPPPPPTALVPTTELPPAPPAPPPAQETVVIAAPPAEAPAPPPPAPPSVSSAPAKRLLPPARELRRDPVEPPLPAEPAWREWLLTVTLNGRKASEGGLFVEPPGSDGLAAQLALLQAWRVRTDAARVITFQGEPYYPLDAIPGARFTIDRQALTLELEVPPEQFTPYAVAAGSEQRPRPVAGTGGFLDYDLLAQAGDDLDGGLSGLVELGGFGPAGTGLSSFRLDDLTAKPGVTRLDTTLSRDVPLSRTTVRLGDSIAVGGALAPPVRFGGLQYATNFAVDPTFVTFPLPAIGGLARQDSVVDLFIDELRRDRRSVPPGPFSIDNLPVVTGAGEVQLRVTDLLGREQVVTQPYYVSSRLLKPGLHDFSYEAGALRRDYGRASFDYGDPIAAATHRYGFSDAFTGEAHGEVQLDRQSLALGGSWLAGRYGVVSGGIGGSAGDDGPGVLGQLGYEYDGRRVNFGVRTRFTRDTFRQAGSGEEAARTDQVNLGLDLDRFGRLGLLFLHRDGKDTADATSLSTTYSIPLGPGALTLRAGQLFQPESELALTALYTVPLGPRRSLSSELTKRGDAYRAGGVFRQTRGASDLGLDYRLAAEAGTDRSFVDARFGYQSTMGAADLELEHQDGGNSVRAGVNGSLALVDGEVAMSRRIGRAFGLVDLPGFPDVRVYLDNREAGRTDGEGRLLLPGLRPYESNRVRLEVQDLPLDAEVTTAEVEAVPFERSGVTIGFPVARAAQATAVLRDAAGAPLPVGLRLRSATGAVTAWVARDGFTQVKGQLGAPVTLTSEGGGQEDRFACDLPAVTGGEILPDLGVIACR